MTPPFGSLWGEIRKNSTEFGGQKINLKVWEMGGGEDINQKKIRHPNNGYSMKKDKT